MQKLTIFLLLLCFFSNVSAEPAITSYITSENDTLSLVDNVIDAYNGKFVQIDKDIEIQGSDPLEVLRYYDAGHHFDSEIGYGVGLSFPTLLVFNSLIESQNLRVEQRSGFDVLCTVVKQKSDKKKKEEKKYKGSVDPEFFKMGYTNCCEGILRGEPSLRSLKVEGCHDSFTVILGDGTKRHYSYFANDYPDRYYRLVLEECSNGNHRHFSYINNNQLLVKRIWTTDPSDKLTLNWLDFTHKEKTVQINASNGQSVCYHLKEKKGKAKNSTLTSSSSVKFWKTLLEKVTSNNFPQCEYDAISRSHYTSTLFSTNQVLHPDGRFLKVEYDDYERVKKLWISGLDVPLYKIGYHSNHNEVIDANGGVKQFYYSNRRLTKLVEPHRIQYFSWDNKGQLEKQILANPNGKTFIQREYLYDDQGNIIETKIQSTIRENQSKDSYVISYHYSDDGRNLLLDENHPEGHTFSYTYVPNTNLVSRKLTLINQKVVEREFYQYDSNRILICTICDDGCGQELNNLEGVSYRKVIEIVPQLDPKLMGMTLPKIIKEGYEDLKTGSKKFLKRIERSYGPSDLLTEEKIFDAAGKYCYSILKEYNNRHELISETDPMGVQTVYRYDNNGNKIYEEKIGSGRHVEYDYDVANRLRRNIEYIEGGKKFTTSYDYDALGNRISIIDEFGQKSTIQYDLASRETKVTDPLGRSTSKEYDVQGNITRLVDQDGYETKTIYNIYGNPLEIQYPDNTKEYFVYNLQGHLIQKRERDGLITRNEVDYQGRIIKSKIYATDGSLLKTLQKNYKGPNLVSEIDAKGNQTSYNYDDTGRLISKIQDRTIITYEYDTLGRIAKTITSENVEIKLYDFLDRVIEERTEDNLGNIFRKICYEYDLNGNCISKKIHASLNVCAETKSIYDSKNRLILTTDPIGKQTSVSYSSKDHLEKETIDPLGRRHVEIFDPLQRLKEVFFYSPSNVLVSYHSFNYDGRGNQILQKQDILLNGQKLGTYTIAATYDSMGQKTSETEQGKKSTLYTYQQGRLKELINPDGVVLYHTYDSMGHLARLTASDGSIDYNYNYDLNDNLQKVEDLIHHTVTQRSYDVFNRQIHEKQATGLELFFTYDDLDRIKDVSFADHRICYDYSPSTLTEARRYLNNKLLYSYTQTTDWRSKVLSCQLPNEIKVSYSWDLLGRSSRIDTSCFKQSASYDSIGNLTSLTVIDPIGLYETKFTYDDLNQLASEIGHFSDKYQFDSIYNRRSKNDDANTIDDLNLVKSDKTFSYTHDLNGRRLTKNNEKYSYDALGRLILYANDNVTIKYLYDPFGRLIERVSGKEKIQFLYQFDTEIASFENGNMIEFRALRGTHSPFAIELEGTLYSPILNHRGDLCVLLDSQNQAGTYRYSAFGELIHEGDIVSPWLFSGQRYDFNTNLYHFAKREYDPCLGIWLTPDPLGFSEGPNLYAYVKNNPLIYTDPYGLWKEHVTEIDRHVKEFTKGASRGIIDDTTFGASDYFLGEHQHTSFSSQAGYYTGTACSMGAGLLYGGTWAKAVTAGSKLSLAAFRSVKTAITSTKSANAANDIRKVTQFLNVNGSAAQKVGQSILKTDVVLAKDVALASRGADSLDASIRLNKKLLQLENATECAVLTRVLPDGRIRYYKAMRKNKTNGPTLGASYTTEYNPKTGNVRAWDENYNLENKVTRVHPKNINGFDINVPHYPPTYKDLLNGLY